MSQIRKVLYRIIEKDPVVLRTMESLRQFALAPIEAHEDIFGEETAVEPVLFCFLLMFQHEEELQIITDELRRKRISFEEAKDEILLSISENCVNLRALVYKKLSLEVSERRPVESKPS